MTAANWPRGNVTSMPRSASTAASPVPNVRLRPFALTAAPALVVAFVLLDRRRLCHRYLLVCTRQAP